MNTVFVIIIGGLFGYWIRSLLKRKEDIISRANEEKRKSYKEFTDFIFEILSKAKKPSEIDTEDLTNRLYKFYSVFVLYGSPTTIKKVGSYIEYIFRSESDPSLDRLKIFEYLGDIFLSMRNDLGLDNKNLSKTEVFRMVLKDYKEKFEQNTFSKSN